MFYLGAVYTESISAGISMSEEKIFTVGGTVQANDGLYLPRMADEELFAICKEGIFAYVLTARQMGKSSLMIHTAQRLSEEGIRCVIIDLQKIGTQVSPEQWYLGLLVEIEEQLELTTNVTEWWHQSSHLGITQKFNLFLETVLLEEVSCKVVIFVDEIDTTIGLAFSDDFFVAIRFVYNARAQIPKFKRLSVVLLGVATPSDLIQDPQRTPFNIGRRVELTDFVFEEALPLLNGFGVPVPQARQIMEEVFKWTNGHPYLTQRLCQTIAQKAIGNGDEFLPQKKLAAFVEQIVRETFFGEKSEQDNNIQFVRDMLTKRARDKEQVLEVYRSVHSGKKPVADEERSLVKSHLKLAGVVRIEGNLLRVRNAIYEKVFDERWIREHMPVNWPRRLQRLMLAVIILFLLAPGPLAYFYWLERNEAKKQRDINAEKLLEGQANDSQGGATLRGLLVIEAIKKIPTHSARTTLLDSTRLLPELVNESPPHGEMNDSTLSRDGRFLAGMAGNSIKMIEAFSGRKIAQWPIEGDISIVPISTDGLHVTTFDKDKSELTIWDVKKKVFPFRLNLQSKKLDYTPEEITVSPSGEFVVGAGSKGSEPIYEIMKWNKAKGTLEKPIRLINIRLTNQKSTIRSAEASFREITETFKPVISPESNFIAVRFGHSISVFNRTGKLYTTIPLKKTPEQAIFSNDEKLLAVVTDNKVSIFKLSKKEAEKVPHVSQYETINKLSFDPKSATFATLGVSEAHIWSIDGKELMRLERGDVSEIISLSLGDDSFITSHPDGSVRKWSMSKFQGKVQVQPSQGKDGNAPNVRELDFSPDGKHLALALTGGTARIIDLETGHQEKRLEHKGVINKVEYSPDGKTLATGGRSGEAYILKRGDREHSLRLVNNGQQDTLYGISFDPRGETVLTSGMRPNVVIWNKHTGKPAYEIGNDESLCDISFNPVNKNLFATSTCSTTDKTARIWDISDGSIVREFDKHKNQISGVAFSPDGKYLATSSWDKTARIWDINTQKELARIKDKDLVNGIAFSADGQLLATASNDHNARVYKVDSGKTKNEPPKELLHADRVHEVAFSPSGQFLATSTWGSGVSIWDIKSMSQNAKPIRTLLEQQVIHDVVFSPSGHLIATAGYDKTARVFEVGSWREIEQYSLDFAGQSVVFSPDEKQLAVAAGGGLVTTWNAETGTKLATIFQGSEIRDFKFSANNQYLFVKSGEPNAAIWDASKGLLMASAHNHAPVVNAAFSPDEQFLRILDWDMATRSLSIASKTIESSYDQSSPLKDRPTQLGLSPKGKYVALMEVDNKTLHLRNFQSNQDLATLKHKEPVEQMQFSFSEDHIAVVDGKKTVRIWEVPEKVLPMIKTEPRAILLTHKRNVKKIMYSPDDKFLATIDEDAIVRIWELPGGREIARYDAPNNKITRYPPDNNSVRAIAFSPDSKRLGIAGPDGYVRIVETRTEDVIAQACRQLNRNLTWDEWKQSFGDEPYRRTCEKRSVHASVIEAARELAKADQKEEAIALFRHVKDVEPELNILPEQEVKKYGAIGLIEKGERLLTDEGDHINEAIAAITDAKRMDTGVKIEAKTHNRLCWYGSLKEHASDVMSDCNYAINNNQENQQFRKSRGVARALVSDYPGAIDDLNAYAAWLEKKGESYESDRLKLWIKELKGNHNPFDVVTREELLEEESL